MPASDPDVNMDGRWLGLYAQKMEAETARAFRCFRSQNIEPVLIKGWAAARNYPPGVFRSYSDIDLAVPAVDYDRAVQILASEQAQGIGVDLHKELRQLDTKPWMEICADSQIVELDDCAIRIPSPEDHLRILSTHWLNDGGENKDRLWDIYYAVANRPDSFNWERCLNDAGEVRGGWVTAVIGLANRYLGLKIDDLPFKDAAKDLPAWIIRTVEREWSSAIPLRSLHTCLSDPVELFRQIRKRLPPNPLQATIEAEGDLRKGGQRRYQLQGIKRKAVPVIRGTAKAFKHRFR